MALPAPTSSLTNKELRESLQKTLNENGFFVTNPINKSTTITSKTNNLNEYVAIVVSYNKIITLDTSEPSNTFPNGAYDNIKNIKERAEGAIIVKGVKDGIIISYWYNGIHNNYMEIPIDYDSYI